VFVHNGSGNDVQKISNKTFKYSLILIHRGNFKAKIIHLENLTQIKSTGIKNAVEEATKKARTKFV
jgi:hypothetical protein